MFGKNTLKVKEFRFDTIDCIIFVIFVKLGQVTNNKVFTVRFSTSRKYPKPSKLCGVNSYV